MQIIGMDMSSGPDMTTIHNMNGVPIFVGDRILLHGQSNRHRTVVVRRLAGNSAEIKTFIRPSRGFAKHVRRNKSREH